MTGFETFQLKSEILKSLGEMEFINPTEVQEKAIPLALEGKDIIVRSKTGTGKTGAFLIPILQRTKPGDIMTSLIILPTRELALQVYNVSKAMASHSGVKSVVVYGGANIETQIKELRQNPSIVVGTPGRLIDLMKRGELTLKDIRFLVLDEADIMLDMGFIEDIEYLISKTPKEKQSMLFSATVQREIMRLTKHFMRSPSYLKVGIEEQMTVNSISHSYAISNNSRKIPALVAYIKEYEPRKSIIFAETKRGADHLYNVLVHEGFDVTVIHGDLTQAQREKALLEFREGGRFLIATNVASRGLDISDISDIINFDLPGEPFVYVHRVGRSARMGNEGRAFTIIYEDELDEIRNIEKSVNIQMMRLELSQELYQDVGQNLDFYRENKYHGNRHEYGNRSSRSGPPRRRGNGGQQHRGGHGNRYPRRNRSS